jgi:hypothetical protein
MTFSFLWSILNKFLVDRIILFDPRVPDHWKSLLIIYPFLLPPGPPAEAFFGAAVNNPLSIAANSTRPGINWKTTIRAPNPRKSMSRIELPFASLTFAARAGVTDASVTANVVNMAFMASSNESPVLVSYAFVFINAVAVPQFSTSAI